MVLITLAGIPTAILFAGISLFTTAPAPIVEFSPIFTFSMILTCGAMYTLSPITAAFPLLDPIDKNCESDTFLPNIAVGFMMMPFPCPKYSPPPIFVEECIKIPNFDYK